MRKLLRELRQRFPGARITVTGSSHYRITLPGGGTVIVSNTPSRKNFLRNAISDARRQSKRRSGR